MPKAKKKWKKAAPDALDNFKKARQNWDQDIQKKPDRELFTTDIDTQEVQKVRLTLREKLELKKKKEEAKTTSKTEKLLVKRKMAALMNKGYEEAKCQKDKAEDVWDEQEPSLAKKKRQYKDYAKTQESVVPVILKPHPGQSYNPEAREHQKLLKKVAERTIEEIEKEEELKRRVRPSVEEKILKEEIEEIAESRIVGPEEEEDEEESEDESNEEGVEAEGRNKRNLGKETRWKSQKKRLLKTMNKLLQAEEREKRKQEKILKQAVAIPSMLGELEKRKREEEKKEAKRLRMKAENEQLEKEGKLIQPKRLGRHAYKQPKQVFQLSEELPDSLRRVRQASSVLDDRVDSLMSRGKIEVPWDAETLKRSEFKKGSLRKKLRTKTYERSTGIERFTETKKPKEDKKKGIFY